MKALIVILSVITCITFASCDKDVYDIPPNSEVMSVEQWLKESTLCAEDLFNFGPEHAYCKTEISINDDGYTQLKLIFLLPTEDRIQILYKCPGVSSSTGNNGSCTSLFVNTTECDYVDVTINVNTITVAHQRFML